jgi:hypothetical protein
MGIHADRVQPGDQQRKQADLHRPEPSPKMTGPKSFLVLEEERRREFAKAARTSARKPVLMVKEVR